MQLSRCKRIRLYCPYLSVENHINLYCLPIGKVALISLKQLFRQQLTIAFFEYKLLYVNAPFEIIALMKPVQLKESSVSDAIDTPGV